MKQPVTTLIKAGIAIIAFTLPQTSLAGTNLTAEEIAKAVSDHTYQGSMTKDAFVEYYSPDGSIRGKNYSGKWRTMNNAMCFQYGSKPETCWDVIIQDTSMTMLKDGVVDGNGMLIKGNFFDF